MKETLSLAVTEHNRTIRMQRKRTVTEELATLPISTPMKNIITGVLTEAWAAPTKESLIALLGSIDRIYTKRDNAPSLTESAQTRLPELFTQDAPEPKDFLTMKQVVAQAALTRTVTGHEQQSLISERTTKIIGQFTE